MEKYDVSKASAQGDTVIKDVDKGFVRAMDSSIAMVRPGSPSYTLQPPTHSTDWVQEVASHMLMTYQKITPTSREVCHARRCHIRHTLTHHIANSPTENSSDIFSASGKFTHGYSTRHPIPPPTQLRHPLSVTANYGFNKISIIKLNLMTLICLEFIFGHMGEFA